LITAVEWVISYIGAFLTGGTILIVNIGMAPTAVLSSTSGVSSSDIKAGQTVTILATLIDGRGD
jgi:hypothetical protein